MEADIDLLYESDFYRVLNFKCRCIECCTSKPEYSTAFSISFVRKGNFLFNVFRHSLDSYTGCILVTKPGYERTVTHTHSIADECTILEFKEVFYREILQPKNPGFFRNNDLHSALVKSDAELEYLHFIIMQSVLAKEDRLKVDALVVQVVEKVLPRITAYKPDPQIDTKLKKAHLLTIERAKEYITRHFTENISLMQVAGYSYVSAFHFSRLFKIFTASTPHQFLLQVRLKNAEVLLKTTGLPIGDIAFSSGFNSIENFTAAFKKQYAFPPSRLRMEGV